MAVLLVRSDRFVWVLAGGGLTGDPIAELTPVSEALVERQPGGDVVEGADGMRSGGLWDMLPTIEDVPVGLGSQGRHRADPSGVSARACGGSRRGDPTTLTRRSWRRMIAPPRTRTSSRGRPGGARTGGSDGSFVPRDAGLGRLAGRQRRRRRRPGRRAVAGYCARGGGRRAVAQGVRPGQLGRRPRCGALAQCAGRRPCATGTFCLDLAVSVKGVVAAGNAVSSNTLAEGLLINVDSGTSCPASSDVLVLTFNAATGALETRPFYVVMY